MVLNLAIVGAGGFAGAMTDLVLTEGARLDPAIRLVAVAEPDQATHGARLAELRARGVATYASYDELLARPDIEAVWLPLPIGLHRAFTERALAAGKAVLCEKPVAGSVQDVDAMIAAERAAKRPVAIGYQNTYEPATKVLKDRLHAGAIGTPQYATLEAGWPRSETYYRRNQWAGRFQQNGVWVMDSPANNAVSHYLHLALFLLDAAPVRVAAELYRALPIENYDTVSLRVTLAGGLPLLVLFTHACEGGWGPNLIIHGTAGRVEWTGQATVFHTSAGQETLPRTGQPTSHMLERFARLVQGRADDSRLVATLAAARAQTVVINAASEAAAIVPVPRESVRCFEQNGERFHVIDGIQAASAESMAAQQMLHESGRFGFTRAAGELDVTGYSRFRGPKQ